MRSMHWQLGILGTISAFGYRHKETNKNLCHGGNPVSRRKPCIEEKTLFRGEKPVSRRKTCIEEKILCRGEKPVLSVNSNPKYQIL